MPSGARTRFAPAPTGYLHLGHVANAIYVWGSARSGRGQVLLRIEDHDRQRSRAIYDAALLEDLAWLGFRADAGPVRQSDDARPYEAALATLDVAGRVYACACTRSTFAAWTADHGRPWTGPGCPSACRDRDLERRPGHTVRAALGEGDEAFDDVLLGHRSGPVADDGDLAVRDRHGNWTYAFCVVVDDLRQGIDLVVRGEDLLDATPRQLRLGRLLGRGHPSAHLHHPLVRKTGGAKLSKADHDTGIRDLRVAGWTPGRVIGAAAAAVGLLAAARPLPADDVEHLLRP